MGHGKAKGNGKAKHECHVCGKSGHHSTSCPKLAQDVLKALDQAVSGRRFVRALAAAETSALRGSEV